MDSTRTLSQILTDRKEKQMGIQIYRYGNWKKIDYLTTSLRDFSGLDREKDRELINYLILHAPKVAHEKLARRFGLEKVPVPRVNIEDKNDKVYPTYFLLREQVERETDYEVLREVAFSDCGDAGSFAFCRLTGFSWPPDQCDAYSYRTFACGLKSGVTRKDIEDLCREMIEKNGHYAREAEEWLSVLPDITDEQLAEWQAGDTERKGYQEPWKEFQRFLGTDKGREYSPDEVTEMIREAFDAYILMIYEEKDGVLPISERRAVTDEPCRVINEIIRYLDQSNIENEVDAVRAILILGKLMKHEYTAEWLKETAWSESEKRPQHRFFIEMAKEMGYEPVQ